MPIWNIQENTFDINAFNKGGIFQREDIKIFPCFTDPGVDFWRYLWLSVL